MKITTKKISGGYTQILLDGMGIQNIKRESRRGITDYSSDRFSNRYKTVAEAKDHVRRLAMSGYFKRKPNPTYRKRRNPGSRKPTIYEALKKKLGREPKNEELRADVQRILHEGTIERAGLGKLRHQRRRNPGSKRDGFNSARPGDKVTFLQYAGLGRHGPEYKQATGRVVMIGTHGPVLKMPGRDTPAVVTFENFVSVKKHGARKNPKRYSRRCR